MGTGVSYPYEVNMKAIEKRLAGTSTRKLA